MEREIERGGLVESRIAYSPHGGRSPGHGPGGSTCHAGIHTYMHVPHNTRSAVRSRTYITIRRIIASLLAWQCLRNNRSALEGGIVLVREGERLVVESGVAGCGPCASGRDGVVSDAIAREFAL